MQVYVDDIIFGATNEAMCEEFAKMIENEFERSMIGELNFFLGATNQANFYWNHDTSTEIYQRVIEEIQHGLLQVY